MRLLPLLLVVTSVNAEVISGPVLHSDHVYEAKLTPYEFSGTLRLHGQQGECPEHGGEGIIIRLSGEFERGCWFMSRDGIIFLTPSTKRKAGAQTIYDWSRFKRVK